MGTSFRFLVLRYDIATLVSPLWSKTAIQTTVLRRNFQELSAIVFNYADIPRGGGLFNLRQHASECSLIVLWEEGPLKNDCRLWKWMDIGRKCNTQVRHWAKLNLRESLQVGLELGGTNLKEKTPFLENSFDAFFWLNWIFHFSQNLCQFSIKKLVFSKEL